jgi:hypothetical protein
MNTCTSCAPTWAVGVRAAGLPQHSLADLAVQTDKAMVLALIP